MASTAVRSTRTVYRCDACGARSPKWQGRCDGCGAWNTLAEAAPPPRLAPAASIGSGAVGVVGLDLGLVEIPDRRPTGVGEVDRVLGGGIVPGSLILLGGDPGIGKSTLALDLAHRSGRPGSPALYCAGEESVAQIALRAGRTGCAGPEVAVAAETDLSSVIATIEHHRPPLAIVDSVQTLCDPESHGGAGSPSLVREAVGRLLACAKATGIAILLVGHVTKDGAIAGPRTLEHMVDVVLYLEGERHGDHRLLRGVKNRFGATDEVGILVMDDGGIRESDVPARALLEGASLGVPGNVVVVTCEGSRPLAVEVQALVVPTSYQLPRRTAEGVDLGRLHLLLAILEKRAGIRLGQADVYVNVAGGVRLGEPAADLGVALAIAGSARDRPLPAGTVVIGEVGLGGEVRRVRRLAARLTEAGALGMTDAVAPAANVETATGGPQLRIRRVATIDEALRALL